MKKLLNSTWLWIIVFMMGILVILYPTISNKWNEYVTSQLFVEYEDKVRNIELQDKERILHEAEVYNASLIGNVLPDAFAEEEANKPNEYYETILNPFGDGMMGTLEIPVIKVKLPVYHYTTEVVLEKGVGHLPGSSLPIGGSSTHSVLSAHRGLPSAKLFTDLDLVKEGDRFFLDVMGDILAYEIDYIRVIEPNDTSDLGIVPGEDYCTLFTCTPYAVNSHRLLVRGHRIEYTPEIAQEEALKTVGPKWWYVMMQLLSGLLGLLIALVILIVYRLRSRKQKGAKRSSKRKKEVRDEST